MVNNGLWHWARDEKITKAFESFSNFELRFLAFVCAWPVLRLIVFESAYFHETTISFIENIYSGLWWMAVGVLAFSRSHIFSIRKIHGFDVLSAVTVLPERKFLLALAAVSLACPIAVWFFPLALPEIAKQAKSMVSVSIGWGFKEVVVQEIQYRLVLYYSLNRLWGRNSAFVFSIICFALVHNFGLYYPMAVIPASILFFVITIATGSLIPAITIHSLINFTFYLIFK